MGSTDPNTPIANGWLRASHRRLDPEKSKPWRPYHPHDRAEPLTPGEVYECDVEIVTSCIVVPPAGASRSPCAARTTSTKASSRSSRKTFHYGTRGTGGMTHNDPDDRPAGCLRRPRHAARRRRARVLSAAADHSASLSTTRPGERGCGAAGPRERKIPAPVSTHVRCIASGRARRRSFPAARIQSTCRLGACVIRSDRVAPDCSRGSCLVALIRAPTPRAGR